MFYFFNSHYDHQGKVARRESSKLLIARIKQIAGTDATVVDFWRFALSNLWMNNARGYLAEFLVAKAVGSTGLRIEWDPYDVLAPNGTTIEVKTSAYLQAWDQYKLSMIQFTGLRSRI